MTPAITTIPIPLSVMASMQHLVQVVNKLQDAFLAVSANPIDLPQIVVIGR